MKIGDNCIVKLGAASSYSNSLIHTLVGLNLLVRTTFPTEELSKILRMEMKAIK